MQDFEKLGVFYLGRQFDLDKNKASDDLVLYDSADLVTHAVCIGMTGSGKTGLCLTLLEEAAMDGIPVIAIDPKGDIGNLLLTFPELNAASFAPWVDEDEARREGLSVEQLASREADNWQRGLQESGQTAERIKVLKEKCEMAIYTPGGTAGRGVSILQFLSCPDSETMEDSELLGERVMTASTSILSLLGLSCEDTSSREHVLLSSIFAALWAQGKSIALDSLVGLIQSPPLERIGALDLESFYPAKERFALALKLNNLFAAPGFNNWLSGEPLDINEMLYTDSGKPRIAIFSINHLNDAQRMFFVTLLANQMISWMRTKSGTKSLRAMFYMDEIFGYFPPVANPPSKTPLLTLLKQARAFGLGLVLATQNPVDLDYKGLSNAGTWFIGRLQTEQDKQRVLDGLESAAQNAASHGLDRSKLSEVLSRLGKRVFLMHNVHEDRPVVFQTRFTMSYLRGPLTRTQIKSLSGRALAGGGTSSNLQTGNLQTGNQAVSTPGGFLSNVSAPVPKSGSSNAAASPATSPAASPATSPATSPAPNPDNNPAPNLAAPAPLAPPKPAPAVTAASYMAPVMAPGLSQFFIPAKAASFDPQKGEWCPFLFASARIHFIDSKSGLDTVQQKSYLIPVSLKESPLPADYHKAREIKLNPAELPMQNDEPERRFAPLPPALGRLDSYKTFKSDFTDWLFANCRFKLMASQSTGQTMRLDESERDFKIRVNEAASQQRDADIAALRVKYASKMQTLDDRINRAQERIDAESAQAKKSDMEVAINVGATMFGALMGRRMGSGTLGRVTSTARGVTKAAKEREDVARATETLSVLDQKLAELTDAFESEANAIAVAYSKAADELTVQAVTPKKSNIDIQVMGIGWVRG